MAQSIPHKSLQVCKRWEVSRLRWAVVFGVALGMLLFTEWGQSQQMRMPTSGPTAEFSTELLRDLASIRDAALQDEYAYQQLSHLTENIGPRPSGSPQAQAAAEHVARALRELGLDVRLEEVRVPRWVRGVEAAELVEFPSQIPHTTQRVVVTALGGSTATPADGITAPVVVVRNFDELNNLGRAKVTGRIVLFNFPFDEQKAAAGHALDAYAEAVVYRGAGAKVAASLGAVASLIRSVGGAQFRLAHTGWSAPAGIPAGALAAEDADLIAHLTAQGSVRLHLTMTSQQQGETQGYNVIGDLKGSENPEQVVLVSGHLDSWDLGTGALDDGAGVAVAMETAELLVSKNLHPKRTLRVVAWMDEENGGRGREAYTAEYAAQFSSHIAAIESDLGAAHPLGFDAKISKPAADALRPVQDILMSVGASLLQTVEYSPGADLAGMSQAGVPTIGIMQDGRTYFDYHHSAADTLDKVDPKSLRENAAAMAVMAYALASMRDPLPR
jgi:carboxypeptidase Q